MNPLPRRYLVAKSLPEVGGTAVQQTDGLEPGPGAKLASQRELPHLPRGSIRDLRAGRISAKGVQIWDAILRPPGMQL